MAELPNTESPASVLVDAPRKKRFDSPLLPLLWLYPLIALSLLLVQPLFNLVINNILNSSQIIPPSSLLWFQGFVFFTANLSQAGFILLAMYMAWGVERFAIRFALAWLLVGSLAGVYEAGVWLTVPVHYLFGFIGSDPYSGESILEATTNTPASWCTIPLIALSAQLPFWALRMFFGCRLERMDANEVIQSPLPGFSIFDLLVATTVVAASISLAQLGLSNVPANYEGNLLRETRHSFFFMTSTALLVGLPLCFFFLQRIEYSRAWLLSVAIIVALSLVFYLTTLKDVPASLWTKAGFSLLSAITFVGTFCAGLTLLRAAGWRLTYRWGSRREPTAAT